jgi:hypothetical protein
MAFCDGRLVTTCCANAIQEAGHDLSRDQSGCQSDAETAVRLAAHFEEATIKMVVSMVFTLVYLKLTSDCGCSADAYGEQGC